MNIDVLEKQHDAVQLFTMAAFPVGRQALKGRNLRHPCLIKMGTRVENMDSGAMFEAQHQDISGLFTFICIEGDSNILPNDRLAIII